MNREFSGAHLTSPLRSFSKVLSSGWSSTIHLRISGFDLLPRILKATQPRGGARSRRASIGNDSHGPPSGSIASQDGRRSFRPRWRTLNFTLCRWPTSIRRQWKCTRENSIDSWLTSITTLCQSRHESFSIEADFCTTSESRAQWSPRVCTRLRRMPPGRKQTFDPLLLLDCSTRPISRRHLPPTFSLHRIRWRVVEVSGLEEPDEVEVPDEIAEHRPEADQHKPIRP